MSDYKHKPGQGTLFINEKSNERQPDMRGKIITPDGIEYKISAWKKQGAKGEFYSLAIDTYQKEGKTDGNNLPF